VAQIEEQAGAAASSLRVAGGTVQLLRRVAKEPARTPIPPVCGVRERKCDP
jgi:hypothetical protein